jgi:hypothetical protein
MVGAVASIVTLDVLELELGIELALLCVLCVLLAATLATEEVCGLVLVLLLAVKPVSPDPEPPPPPPHALKSEIIAAAKRVLILGKLKLLIRYYLSHATSID